MTIESTTGSARPRLSTGTVVRVGPAEIAVSTQGRGGGRYLERYRLRDGVRVGGGGRAELANLDVDNRAAQDVLRQRTHKIDVAYRAWTRRRADADALRTLHEAIEELMHETAAAP